MIPNFKMNICHQRDFLERPCNFQMAEKLNRKPGKEAVEGFGCPSLWASKTYSILSYIVGGFVGSKSQMNNSKHNLSYDLSAAIFSLLNPCKYEMEKGLRKSDNFCNSTPKITSEGYDKYIVKSSHKGEMVHFGLELLEDYVLEFNGQCYGASPAYKRDFSCDDENKDFSDRRSAEVRKSSSCESVDELDRGLVCGDETPKKECLKTHPGNFLARERFRQLSECSVESTDSESFIVFDGSSQSEENKGDSWLRLENFDFDTEDEDEEDEDEEEEDDDDDDDDDYDDSFCSEHDICSADLDVAEANNRWLRNYKDVEVPADVGERKVRFNEDVKVNKIVAWDFAYRAARCGPWEQMARDRARFRQRILQLSTRLAPILRKKHREKIYKKLYSSSS